MALDMVIAMFATPEISEKVLADLRALSAEKLAEDGKARRAAKGVLVVPKRGRSALDEGDLLSDEIIG